MNWIASKIESLKKWTHDKDGEPIWQRWMVSAAVAVLLALLIIAIFQYVFVSLLGSTPDEDTLTRFGISGDYFGFANAVFSALAFAMFIVTLWMQKHELHLQREEIKNTQAELKGQKQEMQQQNASLSRQTFENTFFGMLQLHGSIVESMSVSGGATGRKLFTGLLDELKRCSIGSNGKTRLTPGIFCVTKKSYGDWYEVYEPVVGHYFRTLYNMMRYIREDGGDQQRMYSRLVRAQLSSDELQLLMYNGIYEWGEKFKPLIVEYNLLKHIRADSDISNWHELRDEYNPSSSELPESN